MYCKKCGEKNPDGAVYCRRCGKETKRPLGDPQKKDMPTTNPTVKENTPKKMYKIRCPNPHCNIRFTVREGQEKCHYCGTSLFSKTKGRKIYCGICSKEITEDNYYVIPPEKEGQKETYLHLECADSVDQVLDEETRGINYPAAVGYGILYGLGAAILWYLFAVITDYKLGIIAMLVGWLVAKGVSTGAGNKRGIELQLISLLIVLGSLFLAEYLIFNHFFQEILAEEGFAGFSLSLVAFPNVLFAYLEEGEGIMDLLFWGIALYEGFVIPGRKKLRGHRV